MPDSTRTCAIDDCDGRPVARGWCNRHYLRWRSHGDPLSGGASPRKPTDHGDGTRTCNECGDRLDLDSFDVDLSATRGRRAVCKACRSAAMKSWYSENRDRQRRRARDRRARDTEVLRHRDRIRYADDRDKRLELVYARIDRLRAEHYGVEFDPTVTRSALRLTLGDQCKYCDKQMDFTIGVQGAPGPDKATIEHQQPISRGGGHTWSN